MEITDSELLDRFPDAIIDHDNKDFYRGLLERRLRLSRCRDCHYWHHPPLPQCPRCWSPNIGATEVSGRGQVFLMTVMHQGPITPGVDYSNGYTVVTVELSEQPGLRFTSGFLGANGDVVIGSLVSLTWIERCGAPFPMFEADPDGQHRDRERQ